MASPAAGGSGRGDDARLAALRKWLLDSGFSWSDALEFRGCGAAGAGAGVFARAPVPTGTVVCTLPRRMMLTVRNSAVHDTLVARQARAPHPARVSASHS